MLFGILMVILALWAIVAATNADAAWAVLIGLFGTVGLIFWALATVL
jgi:hypothetical protein